MAAFTAATNPYTYTEAQGSPVENTLVLPDNIFPIDDIRGVRLVRIRVTTGTVQFANDTAIGSSSPSWTTTDAEITISLRRQQKLRFKCVAQNNVFKITS